MLIGMRRKSSGFVTKLLLLFLALSFGVWGIGDIVQSGGPSTLATVGKAEVTQREFARQLEAAYGGQLTKEMLKNPAYTYQVLSGLINQKLVELEARRLGIIISDDLAFKSMLRDGAFQNKDKVFDKEVFKRVISSSGFTEAKYLENLKNGLATTLLSEAFYEQVEAPVISAEMLYKASKQQRSGDIIVIKPGAIKIDIKSDDAGAQDYYKKNIHRYTIPEFRTISYAVVTAEKAATSRTFSEEELKKAYEENKDSLKTEESRTVDYVSFKKEEDAQKALDALNGGKSIKDVTKELSALSSGTLGSVTRDKMPADGVEDVFSLAKGGYTKPIQRSFGFQIFHVSDIIPSSQLSFEQAKTQLVAMMENTVGDVAIERINQIDDEIAGGSTLAEAAKKFGLKVVTLEPIASEGTNAKGQKPAGLPDYSNFLDVAFKTAEKVESQVVRAQNGDNFIVRVEKITPETPKPFAEVKQQVIAQWSREQQDVALAKYASEISEKLSKGDKLQAINPNIQAVYSGKFRKLDNKAADGYFAQHPLPGGFGREFFELQKNTSTGPYPMEDGSFIIGVLKDIYPVGNVDMSTDEAKLDFDTMKTQIASRYREELYSGYLQYLESHFKVSVNEQALKQFGE